MNYEEMLKKKSKMTLLTSENIVLKSANRIADMTQSVGLRPEFNS
jgi:hypothetical protein